MNNTILNLSWHDVENGCMDIAHQLTDVRFKPDIVLPVLWGGVVPARILMDIMDINRDQCVPITAKSYKDCRAQEDIHIKIPENLPLLKKSIRTHKILIVEEIIDSGRTVNSIIGNLLNTYVNIPLDNIKIATLYAKVLGLLPGPENNLEQHNIFYHEFIDSSRWVIFPWDKQEYMRR